MESLQIMTKTDGHKEERYDPTNKKQIRDIKKMIKEKIKKVYLIPKYVCFGSCCIKFLLKKNDN